MEWKLQLSDNGFVKNGGVRLLFSDMPEGKTFVCGHETVLSSYITESYQGLTYAIDKLSYSYVLLTKYIQTRGQWPTSVRRQVPHLIDLYVYATLCFTRLWQFTKEMVWNNLKNIYFSQLPSQTRIYEWSFNICCFAAAWHIGLGFRRANLSHLSSHCVFICPFLALVAIGPICF